MEGTLLISFCPQEVVIFNFSFNSSETRMVTRYCCFQSLLGIITNQSCPGTGDGEQEYQGGRQELRSFCSRLKTRRSMWECRSVASLDPSSIPYLEGTRVSTW